MTGSLSTRNNLAKMRALNPPGFRKTNNKTKATATITSRARVRCHDNFLGGIAGSVWPVIYRLFRNYFTLSGCRQSGVESPGPPTVFRGVFGITACVGSDGTLGTFPALIARTA